MCVVTPNLTRSLPLSRAGAPDSESRDGRAAVKGSSERQGKRRRDKTDGRARGACVVAASMIIVRRASLPAD